MRKVYFFMCFFTLVFGCKESDDKIAKRLVKDYIINNANDPDSYESVEFGKLDSVISNFRQDPLYQKAQYNLYNSTTRKEMDLNSEIQDSIEKNFVPRIISYSIVHKFRGKNAFGAQMLNSSVFYIDSLLSKVDSVERFL